MITELNISFWLCSLIGDVFPCEITWRENVIFYDLVSIWYRTRIHTFSLHVYKKRYINYFDVFFLSNPDLSNLILVKIWRGHGVYAQYWFISIFTERFNWMRFPWQLDSEINVVSRSRWLIHARYQNLPNHDGNKQRYEKYVHMKPNDIDEFRSKNVFLTSTRIPYHFNSTRSKMTV